MASSYDVFLKTDLTDYTGKWVAISEEGIVASGGNVKQVAEHAKSITKKKILFVYSE